MAPLLTLKAPADRPCMVTLTDERMQIVAYRFFVSEAEALLRLPALIESYTGPRWNPVMAQISQITQTIQIGE